MKMRFSRWLGVIFFCIAGVGCKRIQKNKSYAENMSLYVIPSSIYKGGESFKSSDIPNMLSSLKEPSDPEERIQVRSSKTQIVKEVDPPESFLNGDFAADLGYNQSKYIASSKWITMRYLGDNPAGAGLEGEAQDAAQKDALGKENDSIPVVTAAWAATKIVSEFFSPLLKTLPMGEKILKKFKVQGAYYSPNYEMKRRKGEFDNAFIRGLNYLQVQPSSCFARPSGPNCKPPYLSTGHDPTVIGHEMGHAVFNYLRDGNAFEGFQLVAVNEGFADYFSAAYFSEPVIGRIWKVGDAPNPYLRKLTDDPSEQEMKLIDEVHSLGVVWGSTLWRLRTRLAQEKGASVKEIDRTFLYTITFLGETGKIRLGDAGTALLKAAEVLDHTDWKDIIRNELEIANIALASAISLESQKEFGVEDVSLNAGDSIQKKFVSKTDALNRTSCAILINEASTNFYNVLLIILPLLWPLFSFTRRGKG